MGQSYMQMGRELPHDINSLIQRGTKGLLGVETATGYWGLSTYNHFRNPIFLYNDNTRDYNGYQADFVMTCLAVPNVSTTNVVKLSDTLSITDIEQTICDMVRYNRHEFHLYETVISAYEDPSVNVERLEKLATSYGILDRLRELYRKAQEEIDWENE